MKRNLSITVMAVLVAAGTGCSEVTSVAPGTPAVTFDAGTSTFDAIGRTENLAVTTNDGNGRAIDLTRLVWTTSDAAVATVDATGKVTAKGEGDAKITAAFGTLATATKDIHVRAALPFTAQLVSAVNRVVDATKTAVTASMIVHARLP